MNTKNTIKEGTPPPRSFKKAFTLVELVVVVTILAILGTIGFISLTNFSSKARDGNRVANMVNIEKGLHLYNIQAGSFPAPDGNVVYTGSINGVMLVQVGEVGDTLSRIIKLNTTLKDPLSKTNYVYGTTFNNKQYQIAGLLENQTAYNSDLFIDQAYAADLSNFEAKVSGTYPGYIKYNSGTGSYIANIPSLIFNNATGSVDLLSNGTYYVVNKKKNLPYNTSGQRGTQEIQKVSGNDIIKEITRSTTATLTGVNITDVTKDNFGTIFTGAILESFNVSGGAMVNTVGLTETLKTVVLGGSNTSSNNSDQTPPVCIGHSNSAVKSCIWGSVGTGTFNVPAGTTEIEVVLIGAGGAGYSCSDNCRSGGGAGGSALSVKFSVSGGETATITVPSGGIPSIGTYGNGGVGGDAKIYFSETKYALAGGGKNGTAGNGGLPASNSIIGQISTIFNVLGGSGNGGGSYYGGGGGGAGGGATGGKNYDGSAVGNVGGYVSNQPGYNILPGGGVTMNPKDGKSTYQSGGAGGGGGYGDSIIGTGQNGQPDRRSEWSIANYGASPSLNSINQHGGNGGNYGGGGGGGSHGSAGYGGNGYIRINYN